MMTNKKYVYFTLALILLLVGWNPKVLQAQDFTIPEITVDVEIKENGTVHIKEERTYEFDGDFSWADYRLPREGYSEINDIRVSENGESFTNENTEEPGTFSVSKDDKEIGIKWFYEAEDEKRTFTIAYELEEALVVGPDWSEFFWNYLSEEREKATDSLRIAIALPQSVASDSLYGWSRGATRNLTFYTYDGAFAISAEDISNKDFLKVRTIFPSSVFNSDEVAVTDEDFSLEWAKQDEESYQQRQAEQEVQQEADREKAQILTILVIAISILGFYFLYRSYGKRFSTRSISDSETITIPDRTSPALIGWLMSGRTTTSQHLLATLLDLSRRGYFTIHEEEPEESLLGSDDPVFTVARTDKNPNSDLADWEHQVLEFAEKRIRNDADKLDELFQDSSNIVSKWYLKWTQKIKELALQQNWIDQKSYTGAYWNAGLQSILIIISIVAAIFWHPMSLIGSFIAAILLVMSLVIIRRTKNGEETYHRWEAYKKGLQNADEQTIHTELLDSHFIYATALGLSQKDIERLFKSTDNNDAMLFTWIILFQGHTTTPAAVGSALSNLAASGSTSFPGTSAGAGATAGAAGGGATGGAG